MAHQPELLVLDEPTSGLDALVRREFLESMVDRAAAGQTVFLSSHQIAEVERVADIVAILRKGKLMAVERLDELKARTREVTVTLASESQALPELAGTILSQRRRGRQWQVMVRDATAEGLAGLGSVAVVQGVETRNPSLEEIFVAHMQLGREDGAEHAAAEVKTP
jgi:ABC-2 type transport system ATP-binding protein